MPKTSDSPSAVDRAHRVICSQILGGRLAPGARLTRREMARRTGVSIIPVIEALHRLESEGLVESRKNYGSSVVTLTADAIRDRYALRLAVECQVARMLTRGVRRQTRQALIERASEVDRHLTLHGRTKAVWEEHYNLHLGLAEITECPSLVDAMHRIHMFLLLQWQKIGHFETEYPDADMIATKHEWLLKTILSSDPDGAEAAMRRHITASGTVPPLLVA